MGTLRYMSPEQAMAKRVRTDHRTDVYSLGATMYELLCFQPAFTGEDDKEVLGAIIAKEPTPPRKIAATVPAELETICLKTLEKFPDARYDTARALAEDLRRFTHDLPIVAKRPGVLQRAGKFVRRHRAATIGITSAILLVVASVLTVREQAARRKAEAAQRIAQVEALNESGMFFGQQGKWGEAEREFKKALAINPDHWRSLLGLAWIRKQAYDRSSDTPDPAWLEEAEAACRRARELAPGRAEAINLHGVILKMLGRYDEAVKVFRRLATLESDGSGAGEHHFAAWSNLGMVYALAHDFENAELALRKGVELAGDTADAYAAAAWRNLAALELHLGRPEALDHIKRAVAGNRNDIASRVLMARAQLLAAYAADDSDAVDSAKYADHAANQERPDAKRIRAMAHLHKGELADAIEQSENAIELGDLPTINYLIVALARARQGQARETRNALASAKATWPKDLLDKDAVRVSADSGELWFESAAELFDLRNEAESLLDPGSGQAMPVQKDAEPAATTNLPTKPTRKSQD